MDCLFCSIVDRSIPADIIHEDDQVIAFRDVYPQAPTHILIIPRRHIATINDLTSEDNELIGHMLHTAKSIASAEGFSEQGYRLVMNCNDDGGQTVYHIHLHLLAGRSLDWPPG